MTQYRSLLTTTQNTRDLGGYPAASGAATRAGVFLRSDVQYAPAPEDVDFLLAHGITTVIDLRGVQDTKAKPSGFAHREGFRYFNFPIDEGSGVPASPEEVPLSYMRIAEAKEMPRVFRCILNADTGVMFNCTAGKDRTGVVAAILLKHAGVSDEDIVRDYVLTREYGKERLAMVHKNYPDVDMRIVTPCEAYMLTFLRLFTEQFGSTDRYFRQLGLTGEEVERIRLKLVPGQRYPVTLVPMTREMYHAYFRQYENDPDLYPDKSEYRHYEYSFENVEKYIQKQKDRHRLPFAVMDGDEPVGEIVIRDIRERESASFGIAMKNTAYKDRGYGTAAEKALLEYIFFVLDIPDVYAEAVLTNTRSRHVMEKAGFVFTHQDEKYAYYRACRE